MFIVCWKVSQDPLDMDAAQSKLIYGSVHESRQVGFSSGTYITSKIQSPKIRGGLSLVAGVQRQQTLRTEGIYGYQFTP